MWAVASVDVLVQVLDAECMVLAAVSVGASGRELAVELGVSLAPQLGTA